MNAKSQFLNGFSKNKTDKKLEIISEFFDDKNEALRNLKGFHHRDPKMQELLEEFSENTISNFHMPFSVAPNFLINDRTYTVPMVIEESSVVAAAAKSAKFWYDHGGFKTEILGTEKIGQVHFIWRDGIQKLREKFDDLKAELEKAVEPLTENMRKRGGGLLNIALKDFSEKEPGLMQLYCTFDTRDSMGANFINSCLEQFADTFKTWYTAQSDLSGEGLEIIMCILSNMTPNCRVRCWVEAPVADFDGLVKGMSGDEFVHRFRLGVRVAEVDPHRAVTHNKGIFNGVDAVVLASGNDFRAVEACGHSSAFRNGQYSPLSHVTVANGKMKFEMELPISLGVVGGLTNLHPLVKLSLELLGHPSAAELMGIAAAAGLANNFAAVKSLVTIGIQEGHMKMHLFNIMKQLNVPEEYKDQIVAHFKHNKVSVSAVRKIADELMNPTPARPKSFADQPTNHS